MKSLYQFVRENNISMSVDYADSNPNMTADDKWMASANHYRCELRKGRKRLTIPFSQGVGITREPRTEDVLDCLASDASGIGESFENWCAEYGYDTDSRKAERTFSVIQRQAHKLAAFLGDEAFDELLYRTERL